MSALRKLVLALALVATVVASVVDFSATDAEPPVQPASRAAAASAAPVVPSQGTSARAAPRGGFALAAGNLFAAHSWQPPAPKVAAAAPPPAARAPPLPFKYLGKLMEGGVVVAFLSQGNFTHLLRKGDVLGDYRVEDITPAGMTFTYLRLNEQQRLTFGSTL